MNSKTNNQQQAVIQSNGYSQEYNLIRNEAESKWPEWKITTYNANFATSIHARKLKPRDESNGCGR